MRPTAMCDRNSRNSLNLELHAPQIRPEAFPWGSANVEIHASFSLQTCRSIVTLPSVIDLSALLLLRGEEGQERIEATESLDVEILGYDNGVTFELGNASIPLPTAPVLQQTSKSDRQFRVRLTGPAGVRTGMLAGTFQACSPTSVGPGASEAVVVGVQGPQPERSSAAAEVRDKTAGDAAGREAENDVSGDQPSNVSLVLE